MELNRKIFGTDENSSVADTLNNIAIAYGKLCKYEEALKNYSLSLEINRKIFGKAERLKNNHFIKAFVDPNIDDKIKEPV